MNIKSAIKNEYRQKFSFILMLCLLLLVGYFTIMLISVNIKQSEKKKELDRLNEIKQEQVDENARLQSVIDGGDQEEYIRQTAREKLGYVFPGEKVYYNVTPKN